MEFDLWVIALLGCAYFAAGFVDSIAGGGGIISISAFLLAGAPAEFVLGTNKMAVSLGSASSLMVYARSGYVIWRMAAVGLPVAFLAACLGAKAILLFDSANIARIFIFLLPLGALAVLLPKKDSGKSEEISPKLLYLALPLVCLPIGFYDGFIGVGSGSLFLLAFHLIIGVGLVQASATTKVFSFIASGSGFLMFALQGKVYFLLALPLALANIAGNLVGTKMAMRIGAPFIRKVLLFSLALLLVSLVWKFYL